MIGFISKLFGGSKSEKDVKTVDEMKAAVGINKSITISGFYPDYDGVYEYPISLDAN